MTSGPAPPGQPPNLRSASGPQDPHVSYLPPPSTDFSEHGGRATNGVRGPRGSTSVAVRRNRGARAYPRSRPTIRIGHETPILFLWPATQNHRRPEVRESRVFRYCGFAATARERSELLAVGFYTTVGVCARPRWA
jgi:hypothetical protein